MFNVCGINLYTVHHFRLLIIINYVQIGIKLTNRLPLDGQLRSLKVKCHGGNRKFQDHFPSL